MDLVLMLYGRFDDLLNFFPGWFSDIKQGVRFWWTYEGFTVAEVLLFHVVAVGVPDVVVDVLLWPYEVTTVFLFQ